MSAHDLWLRTLKKDHKLRVWDQDIALFDFALSETPKYLEKDFNEDTHKVRHLNFNPGDVIIDCGAHIGLFSILMGKKFPKTQIYAIECMPHSVENLHINLQMNGVDNVRVIHGAIAGERKKLTIYQSPVNSGSASEFIGTAELPKFEIDAVSLDDFLNFHLGDARVALLKMDIEGSEHEALAAFEGWDKIDRMTIEVHPTKVGDDELVERTCELIRAKLGDRASITK